MAGRTASSIHALMMRRKEMNDGRVIMITGATSGIGRATARRFAQSSTKIICIGRHRSALADVENEINAVGGNAATLEVDVTADDQITPAFDEAIATTGRLDV